MDKVKALHDEIIEKVKEYYHLAHEPALNAEFIPGKSRVNYAGRVFDVIVSGSAGIFYGNGPPQSKGIFAVYTLPVAISCPSIVGDGTACDGCSQPDCGE